jgi:putative ABC transport system permease protein
MSVPINKAFVNKIIKHYLKYDRDNPFIFVSSVLAFLGIAAGVMVLMLAMGIMHGTQEEFKKRLFVMNYPLTLLPTHYNVTTDHLIDELQEQFPNIYISPYYTTPVITKSGSNVNGSILYGVNFDKEAIINRVFAKAYHSSIQSPSRYKLITGETLNQEMGVMKSQKLTLYFTEQQAIGFGTMPLQKRFVIDGSFDSGLKAYDKTLIYTTHEAFQKILKRPKGIYDGIHLYSKDEMNDKIRIEQFLKAKGLQQKVIVQGWWEENSSFFAAMEMEKEALFLVLLLIILVASLNIISSLLMTVMSRRSEIALMKTLGATAQEIRYIFFRLGVIIGISGIVAGVILGFLGKWILTTFDIISLSADVYGFSKLPVDLTTFDFISIIVGTFVIVLISALYPASKGSSIDPLTVLRNE